MAMKHFKAEEWLDFVDGATSREQLEAIQKHLASGPARWADRRNQKSRVIEVLFDSSLKPVFSSARAAYTGIRHMLYRADPFQIDLQIETKPGHDRMVVTGQVLELGRSEIFGSGFHVTLSNRSASFSSKSRTLTIWSSPSAAIQRNPLSSLLRTRWGTCLEVTNDRQMPGSVFGIGVDHRPP
jgi:hypothetical protein